MFPCCSCKCYSLSVLNTRTRQCITIHVIAFKHHNMNWGFHNMCFPCLNDSGVHGPMYWCVRNHRKYTRMFPNGSELLMIDFSAMMDIIITFAIYVLCVQMIPLCTNQGTGLFGITGNTSGCFLTPQHS